MSGEARLEIVDFGPGGSAALLAEYDAEDDVIRISARALERVRRAGGSAAAEAFIAAALAHERFHRARPAASEAAAHEHAWAATGRDPRRFERFARDDCR